MFINYTGLYIWIGLQDDPLMNESYSDRLKFVSNGHIATYFILMIYRLMLYVFAQHAKWVHLYTIFLQFFINFKRYFTFDA